MNAKHILSGVLLLILLLAGLHIKFKADAAYTDIVITLDRTKERFPAGQVLDWSDDHGNSISGTIYSIWNTRLQRGSDTLQLYMAAFPETPLKIESIGKPLPGSGSLLGRMDGQLVALSVIDEEADYYIYDDQKKEWAAYTLAQINHLIARNFPGIEEGALEACGALKTLSETLITYKNCLYVPELGLKTKEGAHPVFTDGLGVGFYTRELKVPYKSVLEYCFSDECYAMRFMNPGSFPYLITRLNDKFIMASNYGGVRSYDYEGGTEEFLRRSNGKSYQLYTSITDGSNLVMGEYPHGRLLTLDAEGQLADKQYQLPLSELDLSTGPEVQSLVSYDGKFFAGLWPWGELYSGQSDNEWKLFHRFFTGPSKPALAEDMRINNEAGQRVYDVISVGDAMYVATSSKSTAVLDPEKMAKYADFLPEYGQIYKVSGGRSIDVPLKTLYQQGKQVVRLHVDRHGIGINNGSKDWYVKNSGYKPCAVKDNQTEKVMTGLHVNVQTTNVGCGLI